MILSIYRDPKFNELLEEMAHHGGKSHTAAKKAEKLICRILAKGRNNLFEAGRLTENGEMRLKNCRKFNLGDGYRLICQQNGFYLIILYIGTHDECSRWLERNKGLKYAITHESEMLPTREIVEISMDSRKEIDPSEEYENELMSRIDDGTLRKLFYGLTKIEAGTVKE